MGALQYVDQPDYAALILRKSFTDLSLPGAIMDRSFGWLNGTDAVWNERDHRWTFPSGAVLQFGYLERAKDRYRYQSAEFQYIGFDELTQFEIDEYVYMFTRLRRLQGSTVPLRVRSASNPGGTGHEWVRQRFIPQVVVDDLTEEQRIEYPRDDAGNRRRFIPSKLSDNPSVDRAEYVRSLSHVDPTLRAQMLDGNWSAVASGGKFKRDWFTIVDKAPKLAKLCRYWDLASTEEDGSNDPDWSAGARVGLGLADGNVYIENIRRTRSTPAGVEALVKAAAAFDSSTPDGIDLARVPVWIEQEPGSAGAAVVSNYQRRVLPGYVVRGHRPTGSKETRADGLAARAEAGQVFLVRGPWIPAFLDEAVAFGSPGGWAHDDQVDAVTGAYNRLVYAGEAKSTNYLQPAVETVVRRGDLVLRGERYVDRK